MAYWSECPICGDKNYYEDDGTQHFDCGFAGVANDDVRVERCGARDLDVDEQPTPEENSSAHTGDISLYRLAFLDAARVVESLSADLTRDTDIAATASRCRDLAQQMRAFAGHIEGEAAAFTELTEGHGRRGATIIDWVSRMKRW